MHDKGRLVIILSILSVFFVTADVARASVVVGATTVNGFDTPSVAVGYTSQVTSLCLGSTFLAYNGATWSSFVLQYAPVAIGGNGYAVVGNGGQYSESNFPSGTYTLLIWRNNTNTFTGSCSDDPTAGGGGGDIVSFDWNGHAITPPWYQFASSTQVVPIAPAIGAVTATQNVNFNFQIYLNDIQNPPAVYAGYEVRDIINGIVYDTSLGEQSVLASGLSTFNSDPDPSFPIGGAYTWRPYIRDSNGIYVYGTWSPFSVVNKNDYASPFTVAPDPFASSTGGITPAQSQAFCDTNASSTIFDTIGNSLCKVVLFLVVPSSNVINNFTNLPSILASKPPFSLYARFSQSIASSTSVTGPDSTLSLTLYGSTIPIVASSTAQKVGLSSALPALRTLVSVSLWFLVGWFIIVRLRSFV